MLALTVRQPWPWAMIHAGKRIENRKWRTRVRGEILIHSAKGMTLDEYEHACWWMEDSGLVVAPQIRLGVHGDPPANLGTLPIVPGAHQLARGGIVARARIVDCVSASDSRWFVGPIGFVLDDVRETPFVKCGGSLGFWEVSEQIMEQVNDR